MAEPALSIDIKHARVLKNADLFMLTNEDGSVPGELPGLGLFYRDCRYLSKYELSLDGQRPLLLMSTSNEGFAADIQLTNPALCASDGAPISVHALGIEREQMLIAQESTFVDVITFRNYTLETIELPFAMTFAVGFEDIFALRGTPVGKRGAFHAPYSKDNHVRFGYRGADQVHRSVNITFSWDAIVAPSTLAHTVAHWTLILTAQESKSLIVALRVDEQPAGEAEQSLPPALLTMEGLRDYRTRTSANWRSGFADVRSTDSALGGVATRCLNDLRLLRIEREGIKCIAAGMPWYVGLFGRDSLTPSLQCLAFDQEMAAHTARILARYQGRVADPQRHEEPGKILHEMRVGEMAHLREVPDISYASVDSTLLFLILVARHAAWTGSVGLFTELRANVDRAFQWMAECGDRNGDGYIEYYGTADNGAPVNQGWKDSGDAIVREDGSFPEAPISLVEVQGYAYLAKCSMVELYRRAGEEGTAARLANEAQSLRERFNRDFWMEDKGCYCLGLERGAKQIRVITSNAGQALWSGIADHDKALKVGARLMREDMYSGWGVRTLSSGAIRYNPFAYQLGSIWSFDNALILAGLRRYQIDKSACRIFASTLAAAQRFRNERLPEFFAGTTRSAGFSPPHCPRADPLQAWSAGAVPFMLTELLGLQPNGFDGILRVVRPTLPRSIEHVELLGIKVGKGSVDLRFARSSSGEIVLDSSRVSGELEIQFEGPTRAVPD